MSIRREIAPMLRLALPLVMAEVGWMAMGVVDTRYQEFLGGK